MLLSFSRRLELFLLIRCPPVIQSTFRVILARMVYSIFFDQSFELLIQTGSREKTIQACTLLERIILNTYTKSCSALLYGSVWRQKKSAAIQIKKYFCFILLLLVNKQMRFASSRCSPPLIIREIFPVRRIDIWTVLVSSLWHPIINCVLESRCYVFYLIPKVLYMQGIFHQNILYMRVEG